jgi:cell division protein FtsL
MKETKSDLWNIIALLKKVIYCSFVTIVIIIALFVVYLFKNANSTISDIDNTGVYNLVNSENGEIIATDLTPEDINKILEIVNGEN